jgi:hypothetical protein
MRLSNYLTEDEQARQKMVDMIKRDCQPFLNVMAPILGTDKGFVRRTSRNVPFITKLIPRTDRKPTDTDLETSLAFDDAFMDKFGWKGRSEGVFTYPADLKTIKFNFNLFYPIGEFKYIWSPKVRDLYLSISGYSEPEDEVNKFINTYIGKDLLKVFETSGQSVKNEVMFKCKAYYLINMKYKDLLKKEGIL